ncbi:phosphate ABC transporter substrate-binding protein [Candidatus Poribacteria bacterium]|nr:phosphate ABC transporter substrate-binding protein [Candidatus Poribacteria bacterium]MYF55151.1 phosphate ABC transporter substrate-binding protein [Candidatus Poribacteria bacterium]MYI95001.1 phosphate ABC transporter substrate-binding protein [Candidatus Poribacteria bacterium]
MQYVSSISFGVILVLVLAIYGFVFHGSSSDENDTNGTDVQATKSIIKNKGSDTMVNLAQAWAEVYSNDTVSVEVSGGGSGTGVAALINGTVDIANCSRQVKDKEKQQAIDNTGREPIEFIVGYDALAVYVHKDNPIDKITIPQLAEIYGEEGTITKWDNLGVANSGCRSDKIIRISRQSNSGTYFYFREALLGKERDFELGSLDLHGSKDVVEVVGRTHCAIGYSGMGYATDHVKKLKVATAEDAPYYAPNLENVLTKSYPIARPLYMYSLGEPTGEAKAYLDWILSPEGQKIVQELGFVPLQGNTTSN